MDEFSFINSIKQSTYKQSTLLKGVGDDAAVFRQSSKDIVTAVDTFVEGIHFSRKTMDPFHIGNRALAANISDMAAMGASPVFYLVSIVIPSHWTEDELSQIYRGMQSLAKQYKIDLIGGDTVSGNELTISITVIGYAACGKARYRSTAVEGDIVFVTGTLGDSIAGYHILMNPGQFINKNYYYRRHQMPDPRVAFALELEDLQRVALNDISDGIANEAAEIAEASGVSITINYQQIPTSDSFSQFTVNQQRNWPLFGGEDFELLGAVPKRDWPLVQQAAQRTQTMVTEIGYVDIGKELVYLQEENGRKPLNKKGYTHFKQVKL
ncbi:thiamine-phosphate kinase [Virgibacillus oceani]|uniref:Thiamine-monophosphate kinase n=1 Tax=Virgibacillus oceani TaxID=1479511 RepID=A0A917HBU1_9BACI|nr:thiamine-phosphate kinase [Virgibacillus oceani]GGG73723.1 thiamine-monophosphate kinase [Virgibacillus oceani]